jgi:hypothetical protein
MQSKRIEVRCECGSDSHETIGSLATKIFEGAKNLEVLINQNPLDLLRTDAPSAKECPECGIVYFNGEDARVDAGLRCGNCAYRI